MADSEPVATHEDREKSPVKKKKSTTSKTPLATSGTLADSTLEDSGSIAASEGSDAPSGSITPATPEAARDAQAAPTTPEKLEKMLKERFRMIEELLATEYTYVNDLKTLVNVFFTPLSTNPDVLPKEELPIIFSNAKSILDFNETLYKELRKTLGSKEASGDKVGFLKMYSIYCQNRPNSLEAQERCKKKYPKFAKFLEDQMAATNGLSLDSYLVKPVQRICRYPLLFTGLLKNTPHDHPDYTVLQKALEQLQKVANDVNEFSKKKDNDDKLFDLALRMQDYPETLNKPGRVFVTEREIDVQVNDASEKSRFYVALFDDMILLAKPKKKKLQFKYQIPVASATAKELPMEDEELPIEIVDGAADTEMKFILYETTKVERDNWIKRVDELGKVVREKQGSGSMSPSSPSIVKLGPKKKTQRSMSSGRPDTFKVSPQESGDAATTGQTALAPTPTDAKTKRVRRTDEDDLESSGSSSAKDSVTQRSPSVDSTARRNAPLAGGAAKDLTAEPTIEDEEPKASTSSKRMRMKRASSVGQFNKSSISSADKSPAKALVKDDLPKLKKDIKPKDSSDKLEKSTDKEPTEKKRSSKNAKEIKDVKEGKTHSRESSSSGHSREGSAASLIKRAGRDSVNVETDGPRQRSESHSSTDGAPRVQVISPVALSGNAEADVQTLLSENASLRQKLEAALLKIEEVEKKQSALEKVASELDNYVTKLKVIIR